MLIVLFTVQYVVKRVSKVKKGVSKTLTGLNDFLSLFVMRSTDLSYGKYLNISVKLSGSVVKTVI